MMTKFSDIQMGRKLNWKHEKDLKKAREAQTKAIHKMVCKILRELRKTVDTEFCPLDWINSNFYEDQGQLGWHMGGGFASHEIVITPKFDALNKLCLLHVTFGNEWDTVPYEEDLYKTIVFLLKKL